jgi:hypothetical protein
VDRVGHGFQQMLQDRQAPLPVLLGRPCGEGASRS